MSNNVCLVQNNNNNNNNISLFCEDNILSIAYLTYGPLQVKTIQLFTKAIYKKIKVNFLKSRNYLILIKFSAKISGLFGYKTLLTLKQV